ncbi:hypothetical protein CR513_33229, partial [Mucuna pruriens]
MCAILLLLCMSCNTISNRGSRLGATLLISTSTGRPLTLRGPEDNHSSTHSHTYTLSQVSHSPLPELSTPRWGSRSLGRAVALYTEVPNKIWFGKDVKYDHLRVFGCKCIFIGYGHDEYGYKMYDFVEKKLVRSNDVQFMEDQAIEDIDKVKKSTLEKDNSLSEIDPVRMHVHDLDIADNNVQNGEQHNYGDQQLGDGFGIPLDNDIEEE